MSEKLTGLNQNHKDRGKQDYKTELKHIETVTLPISSIIKK